MTTAMIPPVQTPPDRVIHEGKLYDRFQGSGFRGYVPTVVVAPTYPERKPYMIWDGPKIQWEVWHQVLAFFEWSQKEFKSEVQVRLYMNPTTQRWAAWAFPQKPVNMTTEELPDHADYANQRALFRNPWVLLGTIHHHCTAGAFQSGTDQQNERSQDGVHITVGKIGSEEYDLHARVILRSHQYDIAWSEWFGTPQGAESYPLRLQHQILSFFLKQPPPPDTAFPETWKTNCIKNTVPTYGFQGSSQSGSASATSATVRGPSQSGSSEITIDTDLEAQFTGTEIAFMRIVVDICKGANIISHTRLDELVNAALAKEPIELKAVSDVYAAANKLSIPKPRVDEMIDKWSFDIVIAEIDRQRTALARQARTP